MTSKPNWPVVLLVLAVPLLAHLPELAGFVTCNPIYIYAGLVVDPPHRFLPGLCSIDGNDGITSQALGGRAAEMWLHFTLPWWNHYAGFGLPLAAEAQPGAFFLPFVLILHFIPGLAALKITMQMLAGIFTLAFLREFGLSRAAAGAGAILFALNGSFAWYAHSPIMPIAFLPALLFGLERCRTRVEAGRRGGPVFVSLALAYSLLAGFPETAFMDGLFAALWACLVLGRTAPARRMALVGKIAGGGLAGLALSAPASISFLDYLRIASIGVHALVFHNHLPVDQAPALLLPGVFGPPMRDWDGQAWSQDGGFLGPALTLLALLGLVSGPRWLALRGAMAAWILVWFGIFFRAPGLHQMWAALPLLNEVQVTRYAMPSIEFAATILAALSVEDWRRAAQGRRATWAACAFAALCALSIAVAHQAGRDLYATPAARFYLLASLLEAAAIVAVLTIMLRMGQGSRLVLWLITVIGIDAAGQFMMPEFSGTVANRLALGGVQYLREHAGFSRTYATQDQIPINYGSWFGVSMVQADTEPFAVAWDNAATSIGGNINMFTHGWLVSTPAQQITAFRASRQRLAQAGVRYVVVPARADPFLAHPEGGMAVVYEDAGSRIYDMKQAAPYFETSGGPCTLTAISRDQVQSFCAAPSMLVRRELLLPGWHASVDGSKAAIRPAYEFFQQVNLPAGHATVTWRYAPPHSRWIWGLFFSGAAALAWMFLGNGRPGFRQDKSRYELNVFRTPATAPRQTDR